MWVKYRTGQVRLALKSDFERIMSSSVSYAVESVFCCKGVFALTRLYMCYSDGQLATSVRGLKILVYEDSRC